MNNRDHDMLLLKIKKKNFDSFFLKVNLTKILEINLIQI